MSRQPNTIERLVAKLDLCEHTLTCTACCWEWSAAKDREGYGQAMYRGKLYQAPRLIYCLLNNISLKAPFYTCHTCDNPSCCNWSHLYKGSASTNNRDTLLRERGNRVSGETHHQAKMTLTQVQEVRMLYAQGHYTIAELCRHYPVKSSQMHRILKGEKW